MQKAQIRTSLVGIGESFGGSLRTRPLDRAAEFVTDQVKKQEGPGDGTRQSQRRDPRMPQQSRIRMLRTSGAHASVGLGPFLRC